MTQARGPFPLPQTSPQISGTVQRLALYPGGVYVMPSGNFLVSCELDVILQWFDPLATQWRPDTPTTPGGDNPAMRFINSDGANFRLLNSTGTVLSIAVTAAGSGALTNGIGPVQTGVTIAIDPQAPGLPAAEAYAIVGGSVPAPTVVRPGSKFLVPPIVCCDPPPVGGKQALFEAAIDATGGIATVNVVYPGAGYTSVPQFYIIPQPKFYEGMPRWPGDTPPGMPAEVFPPRWPWPAPGLIDVANVWPGTEFQPNIDNLHGALITGNPLTGSGTLTGVTVIFGGIGYSGATPTVTITGGGLTGATLTFVMGPPGGTRYANLQWKVN